MWKNAKESGEEMKLWPHLIQTAPYKDFTNLSIKQLDMSIKSNALMVVISAFFFLSIYFK